MMNFITESEKFFILREKHYYKKNHTQYFKDRMECFDDDYFPYRKKKCKLKQVYKIG